MHAAPNVLLTRPGSLQLVTPLIFVSWLLTAYPWAWFLTSPPEERWSSLFPPGVLATTAARVALLVAAAAALAGSIRLRRLPLPAFGLLLASIAIPTLAWQQPEIWALQILPIDFALVAITLYSAPRVTLTATSLALGLLAVCLITRLVVHGEGGTPSEPGMALTVGMAVLIGTVIRQRRAQAAAARRQASAEVVSAERLRIARDLHDMVAHSLGVIALQAGAAGRVMHTQPEAAREAIHNIEKVGQETLSGLRRVVSSLRNVDPDRPDSPTAAPSLATLDELIATTRAAGVDIDVSRQGEPRALPMEIDAAAYRIVQEAVANVIRHAETDACRILISSREGELFVEVVDDGAGRGRRPGAGFGLAGMRERVEMLHGTIVTGPRPEGGFRVAAHLPLPTDDR
ncbi:sensor histidine kinase [Salinispora tropica]|uniref:histidine kinase n=1 Tax=Salinispora tropica (strain ATCC BAA-916 / DSM 44818 / JCM 13857 / NBRC 105044 / CNB-440) TaxID=369723 RepID=A4XCA3_SALTO|nr:sensor histidine kinase [Salinispora tropica]ABP56560.1 histidine kinase, dimerisation and phosphoacceptor region [Salinispora tropica CNB-440]